MPPTRSSSSGSDFAASITFFSFVKAAWWITGPMKFSKEVEGPTFRAFVEEMRRGLRVGQREEGM